MVFAKNGTIDTLLMCNARGCGNAQVHTKIKIAKISSEGISAIQFVVP